MKSTKPVYEAPKAEIIVMMSQSVLCASGMKDSSTEPISIETFQFP